VTVGIEVIGKENPRGRKGGNPCYTREERWRNIPPDAYAGYA